jgi:Flp pilus assembly protein TadG
MRLVQRRHDSGSIAVEAVVIVPIAMIIVLLVVQVCLWAHAATLVQGAATDGELAATALGGTPTMGEAQARADLAATASRVVIDPSVQAQMLTGGLVEIRVTGTTEAIIPWLRLPVAATRIEPAQEFRESG